MRCRVIWLTLLCLLLLSNAALAVKWIQVFSLENDDVWSIDIDRVSKSSLTVTDSNTNSITEYDSIIYWLRIDSTENLEGERKITSIRKIEEVTQSPYYYRPIEGYYYYNDHSGRRFPLKLDTDTVIVGDEYFEKIVDLALPYAK